MSEQSQGPGWWVASDGKWFAPEVHPGAQAGAELSQPQPGDVSPPAEGPPRSGIGRSLILGAGVSILVASFLPFYEIDFGGDAADEGFGAGLLFGGLESSWKAWSDAFSLFPLMALVVVAAVVAVGLLAIESIEGVSLPDALTGRDGGTIRLVVAILGTATVTAFVLRTFLGGSDDGETQKVGMGGWLMLAAFIVLLVGVILERREEGENAATISEPAHDDASFTARWVLVTLVAAAVAVVGSFLPVIGAAASFGEASEDSGTVNAWAEGLRPVFALPAMAAALVAILVIISVTRRPSTSVSRVLPARTLRWVLSAYAVVSSVSLLIGNPVFGPFGSIVEFKSGMYLMVVGSLGLLAGCFLERQAGRSTPASPTPS